MSQSCPSSSYAAWDPASFNRKSFEHTLRTITTHAERLGDHSRNTPATRAVRTPPPLPAPLGAWRLDSVDESSSQRLPAVFSAPLTAGNPGAERLRQDDASFEQAQQAPVGNRPATATSLIRRGLQLVMPSWGPTLPPPAQSQKLALKGDRRGDAPEIALPIHDYVDPNRLVVGWPDNDRF